MVIRFPVIVLSFTALLGGIIYMLHLFGLATPANEVYMRFCALGLFIAGFALLGWQKVKRHRFSWDDIYKNNTLIIFSLSILLTSSFLYAQVGLYTVGFLGGAAFLHFLYTRKFYPPPGFFYFILLYALLLFFGTIGTQKGFHFPDRTLSLYMLPLSVCFFQLSKKTLLRIGELFFKTAIIFLAVCILYWWFNFLYLEVDFYNWITDKTVCSVEMVGWKEQLKIVERIMGEVFGVEDTTSFPAYFFVTSWSHYYHPSFVSLVLFFGLITGFYLYHKKDVVPTITKFELILYIALCFFVMTLMESRIGLVGLLFIIVVTGFYYLKLKTKYFKIKLAVYLLLGGTSLFILNNTVSSFADDETRSSYRRIAVGYIQDNFWWGEGFRQQQIALEQQAEIMKDVLPDAAHLQYGSPIFYSHNQFLGDMIQFGIWGLIALVAMLGAIAYYAIRNRSYLLQMMMFIVVLFMMIEEPLYVLHGTIRLVSFLVFFTAISESMKKQNKNTIYA